MSDGVLVNKNSFNKIKIKVEIIIEYKNFTTLVVSLFSIAFFFLSIYKKERVAQGFLSAEGAWKSLARLNNKNRKL